MGMKGLTSVMVLASDIGATRIVGGVGGARERVDEEEAAAAVTLVMIAARRSK